MREVHGWRRLRRWLLWSLAGLLSLVITLIAATLVILDTDYGRDKLRAELETQLRGVFVHGATIGKLEGSPLGELVLRDVVIDADDGAPVIAVGTLRVRLGLLALVHHTVAVTELAADDVDVDTARLANLTAPASPPAASAGSAAPASSSSSEPSAWTIDLESIVVQRAHVVVATKTAELGRVDLDDLAIDASARLGGDGARTAAVELTATWRQRGAAIAVTANVEDDGDDVTVPALAVRVGGVAVWGSHLAVQLRTGKLPAFAGRIALAAPHAAVDALVAGLLPPADIALAIEATPAPASATPIAVSARIGGAAITAQLVADLDAMAARGTLDTGDLDLGALTGGKLAAIAGATVRFDVARGAADGLPRGEVDIAGHAAVGRVPRADFTVRLASSGARATVDVAATGPAHVTLAAALARAGDAVTLESAHVIASTDDPQALAGGAVAVRGAMRVDLAASGALAPAPDLAVTGEVTAGASAVAGVTFRQLATTIDARGLPARPRGRVRVHVVDLERGDVRFGELTLGASTRPDGRIDVALTSFPAFSSWVVQLAALVTPPGDTGTTTIDLGKHWIRAGARGGDWIGEGGRIVIAPFQIAATDIHTASPNGRLRIDAQLTRAGAGAGDLVATVDLKGLQLAAIEAGFTGAVSSHVAVARRGLAWSGAVDVTATGVTVNPRAPLVDASVHAKAGPGSVTLAIDASSPRLGGVQLAADIAAPARLDDAAAWPRLGVAAIRKLSLGFHDLDAGQIMAMLPAPARGPSAGPAAGPDAAQPRPQLAGHLDGELALTATTATGTLHARGVRSPALRGVDNVDVAVSLARPAADELDTTVELHVAPVGAATTTVKLGLPDRPFDAAAWQRLGIDALRGATVHTTAIAIDPALLARFGVATIARGTAQLDVEVGAHARSAKLTATIGKLRGDPVAKPVDLELDAAIDDHGATATVAMTADKATLLQLDARTSLSLAALRADPARMRTTPFTASLTLPKTSAPRLLDVFGRTEITGGTIDGTVDVTGTLAAPLVHAKLVAEKLAVPPGPNGKPVNTIDRLTVDAGWGAHGGTIAIDGAGEGSGTLGIRATIDPQQLAAATAKITAAHFDLAPMLAFAPGPAGGSRGKLDADLTVTGFDPRTAKLAGAFHLRDASLPIAPEIGTMRDAKIDVDVGARKLEVDVAGKLGKGDLTMTGAIALDGANLTGGDFKVTLNKVSPIGSVEPQIDATIAAKLARVGAQWKADVTIDHGFIKIGSTTGEKLKPVGLPSDLTVGAKPPVKPGGQAGAEVAAAPRNPFLVAHIVIHDTPVESEQFRTTIHGDLTMSVDASAVGLNGGIEASGGNVDLFDRRYRVDRANVKFDGTVDPVLDIRITYDFTDLETITMVRGRLSKPELVMTSDPAMYSNSQLLGFLLGGEPNGDPNSGGARDKAEEAGESFVANQIGGYVRKALPIDIDVIKYEAASVSSSAAITVGSWITHTLFLSFSQHIDALPDENSDEATLEWWLTKRLEIQATAGDRNYDAVDILWRRRF